MVFGSSLSPASSGGSRIRRKSSETMISPNPRSRRKSSGRTSPGRTSPSPGSVSPSSKPPVMRNLFGNSSNVKNPVDQHYGEFFHSKVFREEKPGKSLLLKEST